MTVLLHSWIKNENPLTARLTYDDKVVKKSLFPSNPKPFVTVLLQSELYLTVHPAATGAVPKTPV